MRKFLFVLICIVTLCVLSGCENISDDLLTIPTEINTSGDNLSGDSTTVDSSSLIGTWEYSSNGSTSIKLVFTSDTAVLSKADGTGDLIEVGSYKYVLSGTSITFTNGDFTCRFEGGLIITIDGNDYELIKNTTSNGSGEGEGEGGELETLSYDRFIGTWITPDEDYKVVITKTTVTTYKLVDSNFVEDISEEITKEKFTKDGLEYSDTFTGDSITIIYSFSSIEVGETTYYKYFEITDNMFVGSWTTGTTEYSYPTMEIYSDGTLKSPFFANEIQEYKINKRYITWTVKKLNPYGGYLVTDFKAIIVSPTELDVWGNDEYVTFMLSE